MPGGDPEATESVTGRVSSAVEQENLDEVMARARAHAAALGYETVRTPEVTRRLELLWGDGEPAGRGRRPRFTPADVVTAGLTVVGRDGLAALSMRRVATELGVGTMSLYTYVPGRAELVDLMMDRVYAELELPDGTEAWQEELRRYARECWQLHRRHPWLLEMNVWRAPLTPHVLDAQEAGLRTLSRTGLAEAEVARTLNVVDLFVQGSARGRVAEDREHRDSGVDMDGYWDAMSSFWEDYFDVARYPTMARVYAAGGFDAAGDFEDSLEVLVRTVELTVAARRSADRVSPGAWRPG